MSLQLLKNKGRKKVLSAILALCMLLAMLPTFSISMVADAVSFLVNAKLISGKNGLIAPADYTTRAEVAVLLKRILDYTSK